MRRGCQFPLSTLLVLTTAVGSGLSIRQIWPGAEHWAFGAAYATLLVFRLSRLVRQTWKARSRFGTPYDEADESWWIETLNWGLWCCGAAYLLGLFLPAVSLFRPITGAEVAMFVLVYPFQLAWLIWEAVEQGNWPRSTLKPSDWLGAFALLAQWWANIGLIVLPLTGLVRVRWMWRWVGVFAVAAGGCWWYVWDAGAPVQPGFWLWTVTLHCMAGLLAAAAMNVKRFAPPRLEESPAE